MKKKKKEQMLGMVGVVVRVRQEDVYPGSGEGSAFDKDAEPGTFNIRGCKWPAYRLNPAKH